MVRYEGFRGENLRELYKEIFQTDTPIAEPIWTYPASAERAAEIGTAPAVPEYVGWLDDKDDLGALLALVRRKLNELPDPYEDSNALPFPSVALAEIYRQITGIRNYPQLISHFRRQTYQTDIPVHERLGFDSIPGVNTLRKASNERFTRRTNERISYWALHLTQIAIEHEFEFPETDTERLANNGGITAIPIELKRGYAQGALDLLRDDMPIEKSENAIFDDYGLHFDFSLHLCQSGGSPEGELENFADDRGLQTYEDIWGDAETFRNDIYRANIEEWQETFASWTERLLDTVYDKRLRSRRLPIALDTTNIPTWSRETSDLPGVVGTQKLKNTHYAYQILSAEAVSDGMPFQLAHQLQMDRANYDKRLGDLLDALEDRDCNVGLILADSDFASGRIANFLKGRDIDFVISYPKHRVSKHTDAWAEDGSTFGVTDYTINKRKSLPDRADVTLFGEYQSKVGQGGREAQKALTDFIDPEAEWVTEKQNQKTLAAYRKRESGEDLFEDDNRMRWFTFITNLDVNEEEARALREYYHYRWAIESAFSDYKQNFLPTTKSTNLGLRTYLYLFGMTAYNAWVAANVKARRQHLEDSERNRPPIRASRFMTLGQQRYRNEEFPTDPIKFRE